MYIYNVYMNANVMKIRISRHSSEKPYIASLVQKCGHVNCKHPFLVCQESPILKVPVHGITCQSFGEIFLYVVKSIFLAYV